MSPKPLFRIDDISLNTNLYRLEQMIGAICDRCEDLGVKEPKFLFPVSLSVFDMSSADTQREKERIFPAILNAYSNEKEFYKPDFCGMPDIFAIKTITEQQGAKAMFCSHGMFHIDHRLIPYAAQEINILCARSMIIHECKNHNIFLTNYKDAFVPPFNKYNSETEHICDWNGIELIKWSEKHWQHVAYLKEQCRIADKSFYMHTHDFSEIKDLRVKLDYLIK